MRKFTVPHQKKKKKKKKKNQKIPHMQNWENLWETNLKEWMKILKIIKINDKN